MLVPLSVETEAMVPVAVPVLVSSKSAVSTPVTLSSKVTFQITVTEAVVSDTGFSRSIEVTVGAVASETTEYV